jgi:predicted RNA-binding Zn-ribbon protein involved in translation (DUF1610 family)
MTTTNFSLINTLSNGVNVYSVSGILNDFSEAQKMLDINEYTEKIDAMSAYEERVQNNFVASYEVKIERYADFQRFVTMLKGETCYYAKYDDVREQWYRDEIKTDEMYKILGDLENCTCDKCKLNALTMEQWKTNKIVIEEYIKNDYFEGVKKKEMKLGKYLQKAGFSKEIVDFYSLQEKAEKTVFISVLDHVQFVTGMSYYFKEGSTNQYGGTSCQDTRHGGSMSVHLAGALYDNKCFMVVMHDKLSDLENMQDKMLGRSIGRLINRHGKQFLITTSVYGSSPNQNMFVKAIEQLNEVGIYEYNQMHDRYREGRENDNFVYHDEKANGHYEMYCEEEIEIYERVRETVEVECPMCGGSGEYTVYDSRDREHDIECPMCGGSGEYEVDIDVRIDEYVTVESEEEIEIYGGGEGYSHYGHKISIRVNDTLLKQDIEKYNR